MAESDLTALTAADPTKEPAVSGKPPSPPGSKIQTDHRTTTSIRTSLFHHLARAIRPHLVNGSGKPFPPGSPQLQVDSVARKKCKVREYKVRDCWLYELRPKGQEQSESVVGPQPPAKNETTIHESRSDGDRPISSQGDPEIHKGPQHVLYYFAGGGFSSPPTPEHWRYFTKLSNSLPEYRFVIVSYPLAPNSPAPTSIPFLQSLIESLLEDAHSQGHAVTLAGDSAGGNLALVLGIDAVTSRSVGCEMLRNLMAVCPVVDLRNNHPDISSVDMFDPLLTAKFTDEVAARWAATWPRDHPMLSPVFADLGPLVEYGVQVHGVVADRDVLSPDTVIFKEKCDKVGLSGEWLEWEKMMHCFPLAGAYGKVFPESWEGLQWIIEVLQRHA